MSGCVQAGSNSNTCHGLRRAISNCARLKLLAAYLICVLSGDSSIWSCWYSGNAENGVGSVEYRDQTPVSSLSCHIPGGADKGGSTCLRRLGNGDLLRVVADPDFGRTAMRSVGNCCPA